MGKDELAALTVVVDSREQQPYEYPDAVVKGLPTGDYSALGFEALVAIERKSKADAYASLGNGRVRFEREFQRLAKLEYAAVVIESTLEDFLQPPAFTRMNPKSAVNSIIAWSVKYRVAIFFAGNRSLAQTLVYRLLEKFVRYAKEGIYGGPKPSLEGLQERRS